MKSFMSKHISVFYAVIISITISFMFFVVEPIALYATNVNDFWFDLHIIAPSLLLFFTISTLVILFFLLILYALSRATKKNIIFNIGALVVFALFIIAYVHGNFFAGSLPTLNGEAIDWGSFGTESVVSIVICLLVVALVVVVAIKLKPHAYIKYASFTTLAIFAMLAVSLFSTLMTTDALSRKEIITYATTQNINTYSSNKNFLILLLDAVDSLSFAEATKNSELYSETFKDFTYFPDTVGAYSLTRDSIPFIFSGAWDRNETDFITYSTNAYDNSPLFGKLHSAGYKMDFYDEDFIWHSDKAFQFDNVASHTGNVNTWNLLKQETKYILYKYLPFPLKRFSMIDTLDFATAQSSEEKEQFAWDDLPNYDNFKNESPVLIGQNLFQFLHLEGAHVPYNLNEDLELVEKSTYQQKCVATLKIINAYLNRLRNSGVYDNSIIIVMADHGNRAPVNADPILYIKGLGEKHELSVSDKAVWYADLQQAFDELLDGKKSTELFGEVSSSRDDRIIISIPFQHEDAMTEYVQRGKAWDSSTIVETGNIYNR